MKLIHSVVGLPLAGMALLSAAASAAVLGPVDREVTINFDTLKPGLLPAPWKVGITAGPLSEDRAKPFYTGPITSHWEVVADTDAVSKPNVLKASGFAGYRLCVKSDDIFRDGFVEVRGKAISGNMDKSIGLVFRYVDQNNYYIVRSNAIEGDIGFYRVVGGQRTPITNTAEKPRPEAPDVAAGKWLTLRVEFFGTRNVIYLNGRIVFRCWEEPYRPFTVPSGAVGLWVKGDSHTIFDDFRYGVSTSRLKSAATPE